MCAENCPLYGFFLLLKPPPGHPWTNKMHKTRPKHQHDQHNQRGVGLNPSQALLLLLLLLLLLVVVVGMGGGVAAAVAVASRVGASCFWSCCWCRCGCISAAGVLPLLVALNAGNKRRARQTTNRLLRILRSWKPKL